MHPSYGEELNVGDRIAGRYEILSEIGKGSMGVVYKARHDILGRIVAIKMLRVQRMTDERSKARFEREARAAERLSHPNLINVMDFGYTPEGIPYLIMDYVSGVGLLDILRREKFLAPERAVLLYSQVCDAIYHAHQRGVIHRDLKPGNILIVKDESGQENVKIVDLGVAKIVHGAEEDAPAITGTGEVCGSPIYLSPEQCMHLELDPRTDIYSLGVCLYESLTGVPPLRGATVYDTIYMHVHEMPKPFSVVAPGVSIPSRLEEVVFRCLSKKPDERFETVEQLKLALLNAIQPVQSKPVHVLPPELLFKPSVPSRSRSVAAELSPRKETSGEGSSSAATYFMGGAAVCVIVMIVSLFAYINGQEQKIKELEATNALRAKMLKPDDASFSPLEKPTTRRTAIAVTRKKTTIPQRHEIKKTEPAKSILNKDGGLLTAMGAVQIQNWQKGIPSHSARVLSGVDPPAAGRQSAGRYLVSNPSVINRPAINPAASKKINETPMRRIELPSIQVRENQQDEQIKSTEHNDSIKSSNSAVQIAEEGRNLALIHDYAGATAKFKQVYRMEPTNQYYASCLAHALTSEALLLNRQRNYKAAVAKQKEAAELFPENQLYQNNLCKFQANLENFSAGQ